MQVIVLFTPFIFMILFFKTSLNSSIFEALNKRDYIKLASYLVEFLHCIYIVKSLNHFIKERCLHENVYESM